MALKSNKATTLLGPQMEDYLDYEKANEPYFTTATTLTTLTADAPVGQPVIRVADPQLVELGQTLILPGPLNVVVNSVNRSTGDVTLSADLPGVPPAVIPSGTVVQSTPPRRQSYGEAAFDDHGVVNSWGFATLGAGGVQQRQVGDSGLYQNGRVEVLTSSITGTLNIAIETSIDGSAWNSIGTLGPIAAPGVLSTTISNFDNLIRLTATMSGGAGDSATFKSVLYMKKG